MRYKPYGQFLIYGLRDPRTGEIRYVGKSSSGISRPKWHGKPGGGLSTDRNTYKGRWVQRLVSLGLVFEIVCLEALIDPKLLDSAERKWIAIGREALGKRLTNGTDGGDGWQVGRKHTTETLAKMRKPKSPEHAQKIKFAKTGLKATPETRAKLSASHKGIPNPSKGKTRGKASPETRAKQSETAKKRLALLTPEQKKARMLDARIALDYKYGDPRFDTDLADAYREDCLERGEDCGF